MSDTPRTDARRFRPAGGEYASAVPAHLAADMELELAMARSELAAARAELAEARECLRDAIHTTDERKPFFIARWRKAAGVDSATPTQSGNS